MASLRSGITAKLRSHPGKWSVEAKRQPRRPIGLIQVAFWHSGFAGLSCKQNICLFYNLLNKTIPIKSISRRFICKTAKMKRHGNIANRRCMQERLLVREIAGKVFPETLSMDPDTPALAEHPTVLPPIQHIAGSNNYSAFP